MSSHPLYSATEYPDQQLTGAIIGAAFEVHRAFGFGFLEAVYRRGIVVELEFRQVPVQQEVDHRLFHRGKDVGLYRSDIIVASRIVVEVKTGLFPDPKDPMQLLNYLSAARIPLGLILHFGPKLEVKRLIRTKGGYELSAP